MNPLFEATSEVELLAINRAFLEAKFSGNPNDEDVPGSTIIADASRRVATSLCMMDARRKAWFTINPSNREWRSALLHAVAHHAYWSTMTTASREAYMRALLAPFQVDDETIAHFATEVERHLKMGLWYSIWQSIRSDTIHLVTKRPSRGHADEIEIIAADGKSILYQSSDELMITEWLSEGGFEFVMNGLLPAPNMSPDPCVVSP